MRTLPPLGERPAQDPAVEVLNPRGLVPLSFIIDDSTCLVNLNKFASPHFYEAHGGNRRRDPWETWPDEIPDDFVRKFVDWCGEHEVKGKYSVVPFPACVGRLDRILPGWTAKQLDDSIRLVRERVAPGWDIHPEMVTHTWVIDTKTGHPYPERTPAYMENWDWSVGRSVDELADYMRYALQILHNIDLPCEGLTTPGGFGSRARQNLAKATLEACRDVYQAEIPHYFRDLFSQGEESVAPRVEYVSGLGTDDPRCVVSIYGCTGDWTGGWNNVDRGHPDRFITPDLASGRLVDVITRGEPACLVCHWTGIHWAGEETGFKVFQEVVRRVHERFDNLRWMKLSEIARYWAAKELTEIAETRRGWRFEAPYACPDFTLRVPRAAPPQQVALSYEDKGVALVETTGARLEPQQWRRVEGGVELCFDLPRGRSALSLV